MAEKDYAPLSKVGNNGFLWVLLALFGAAALQQAPLLVEHPLGLEHRARTAADDEHSNTRLWQDPFSPRADKGEPDVGDTRHLKGASLDTLSEELHGYTVKSPTSPPLVMIATLPDGPYAEFAERRRRTRVATVEGLLAEHFVAKDSEHLNFAGDLPYEWFVRTDALESPITSADTPERMRRPSAVLVLWVAESSLGSEPRAAVCSLIGKLSRHPVPPRGPVDATDSTCDSVVQTTENCNGYVVLGPGNSQTLEDLIHETEKRTPTHSCDSPSGEVTSAVPTPWPHFYTAFATMTLESLHAGSAGPHLANLGLEDKGVTRTVGTDEQLAEVLFEELKIRGVDPSSADESDGNWTRWSLSGLWQPPPSRTNGDPATTRQGDDAVALITESDTPYGRAMAHTFCRQYLRPRDEEDLVTAAAGQPETAPMRTGDAPHPCRGLSRDNGPLFLFTYLRGLNGEIGMPPQSGGKGGTPAAASQNADKGKGGDGGANAPAQRSEGDAQTDYLDRLAEQLEQIDRRLQNATPPGTLRAVGLLGTDVYDKLMMLRALKPRLPNAVFFTTDLDARLLDRSELSWTRNLVVASTLGLQLSPAEQHGFAPFRDSYQTASYLTVRMALHAPAGPDKAAREWVDDWTSWTHVFEIGRSGLNELVTPARTKADACSGRPGAMPPDQPPARWWCWNRAAPPAGPVAFSGEAAVLVAIPFAALYCWLIVNWRRMRTAVDGVLDEHSVAPSAARVWVFLAIGAILTLAVGQLTGRYAQDIANWMTQGGQGQPLQLASGISVWPAVFLLVPASLYWAWFALFRIDIQLHRNLEKIHGQLAFPRAFERVLEDVRADKADERRWERWGRHLLPPSRLLHFDQQGHGAEHGQVDDGGIPRFWRLYLRSGLPLARILRRAIPLVILAILISALHVIDLHLPLRGRLVQDWYGPINNIAIMVLLLLLLAVAEASLFCSDFLTTLRKAKGDWPREARDHVVAAGAGDSPLAVPWLQLQITALRTEAITPLIYQPFLFLAVLILSHSSLFSPWTISDSQLVVLAGTGIATVACAWWLRQAAEAVREDTIDLFEKELQHLQAVGWQPSERLDLVRDLLKWARTLKVGALAPFSEQPLIRSLLVPLLSFASTAGLYLLARLQ